MLGFVAGVGRIVQEICRRNGYGRMFYKSLYPQCSFFVITGVYGRIGTCGKHRNRCGDSWRDQEVVLCFAYTPVSTDSLILVGSREEQSWGRGRMNEVLQAENLRSISFLQSA